jgi:hypothetical protein
MEELGQGSSLAELGLSVPGGASSSGVHNADGLTTTGRPSTCGNFATKTQIRQNQKITISLNFGFL